jgi:hypothetical protein
VLVVAVQAKAEQVTAEKAATHLSLASQQSVEATADTLAAVQAATAVLEDLEGVEDPPETMGIASVTAVVVEAAPADPVRVDPEPPRKVSTEQPTALGEQAAQEHTVLEEQASHRTSPEVP